jgi:hypothetical protein
MTTCFDRPVDKYEAFSANVDADPARTAARIAAQLKIYFVNQGWIPAQ